MNPAPPGNAGCPEFRERLDRYVSGELAAENIPEIERHLRSCPQCATELQAQQGLRSRLRAAVRATPVPSYLETKVRAAVRSERAPTRTGLWAVAASAAVIVCVVTVGVLREKDNPEEAILNQASGRLGSVLKVGLRDHLHCAVFRKYSKEPVPSAQMAADLGPAFAGLAPLLQAKLPQGFRIIQAHHCSVGQRAFTHFIVAGGGNIVSVIVTGKQPGESLAGGIHQTGVDRFQVVGFETHDYLAYVISDLDPLRNLQCAVNLAPTLREYLAAHSG